MTKYTAGIIGCGDIGFKFDYKKKVKGALTHFRAFLNSDKFILKAVSDINVDTLKIIGKDFGINTYTDYRKMLEENKLDVIIIAVNDELHYEILKDLITYKPKLVFCEKPLALDYKHVKEICKLYRKKRIHLQVNFTRRFLNEFAEINEILRSDSLGQIESLTFYYSRGLIHNASHYLDLVNWYIGETEKNLIKVSVKKGISRKDETVSFDMIFKNGTEIRFIGLSPSKLSFAEIDITGTKGRLKFNYRNEIEKYIVAENRKYKGYSEYKLTECKPVKFEYAIPNAAENIYNVLEGKDTLKSAGINSLKIFELINRIKGKKICLN
ncbi:MAG: Gfo/Idh/MocA family oxidoreductase [Ignavibacteria bacterium]|nr:Gfo/Idh/MocA family oxidoreductase [Ignavibacteria bacterium]